MDLDVSKTHCPRESRFSRKIACTVARPADPPALSEPILDAAGGEFDLAPSSRQFARYDPISTRLCLFCCTLGRSRLCYHRRAARRFSQTLPRRRIL